MGRHQARASAPRFHIPLEEGPHRRRRWPIATFVAVLLIVGGWFGWSWLHGVTVQQSASTKPASCPAGNETIQIAAAPSIAAAIGRVANAYVQTKPVVTDHCVQVAVSAVDSQAALAGIENGWNTNQYGPAPQAWIADSSLWTNQLPAGALGDAPRSIATSPIVLAVPADAAKAINSANAPTFAELPGLVSQGAGWSTFGEPGWGQFTLDLPNPAANADSALAVEAMLDPPSPQGQPPVTQTLLNSPDVRQNLDNLTASQPMPAMIASHQALVALGGADGLQHAPFSAVPVSEVELYERNLGIDGDTKPMNVLDEVRLGGPTPFEDFPFTPLAGSAITSDQVAAAEDFRDYLLAANAQTQLAQSGLRVPDNYQHPMTSPGVDWGSVGQASTPTDADSFHALATAWMTADRSTH